MQVKSFRKTLLLVFVFASIILSCNQAKLKQFHSAEGETQGTMYHIKYEYKENINQEIESFLEYFSNSLSNFNPESTVSKFNYNSPDFETDSLLLRMVKEAFIAWENTNGAFDITIAPIANLWGFGWEKHTNQDTSQIENIMQTVGMNKIEILDNQIIKSHPEIMIITSGIAKGMS
ncbi:MAG: FAD:protein FMN transferase, partial [Bacteroidales bacterium]|nr:FAD:protein FMN transferase [Bacteroidales bacterium]